MTDAWTNTKLGAAIVLAIAASACAPNTLAGGSRRAGGALSCAPICDADEECGPGTRCVAGRCVGWALRDRCTVDLECGSVRSICGRDEDCASGEVCIDPGGGVGRCAWVPDEGVACDRFGMELDIPRIDGSGNVHVCVDGGATCRGGACSDECESDAQCVRPGAPSCDAVRGECVCRTDDDCVGPSGGRCVDGVCIGGSADTACTEESSGSPVEM